MNKLMFKKIVTISFIFILANFLLAGCAITGSWFNTGEEFSSEDEVASVEMSLLDENNAVMTTFPSYTYSGATTYNINVKVKNNSTIPALARIVVNAYWEDSLPLMDENEDTVIYSYDNVNWSEVNAGDMGYSYVYYNSTIAAGGSVNMLNSISIPSLPSKYIGKQVSFIISVEGLQANSAGVNLWQPSAPNGWSPIS